MGMEAALRLQEKKIDKILKQIDVLRKQYDVSEKKLKELTLGDSFRRLMERVAEQVIPFHYVVEIPVPAQATQRILQPLQTSTKGWFFADRVFGSFRLTEGDNAGRWWPLTHSDPLVAVTVAAGTPIPDILDFTWEYSENRTNMARQNDSLTIPGDLLFRRDGDGFLLGGDPWAPRTTITPAITPLSAPDNAGVFVFTFLGSLCINTPESAVQSWLERRNVLGV